MQHSRPSLFARDDTFFGVCEALGEDLGFNPQYLRVILGVALLWNPLAVAVAYAALAVTVLLTRLLFPVPAAARRKAAPVAVAAEEPQGHAAAQNDERELVDAA